MRLAIVCLFILMIGCQSISTVKPKVYNQKTVETQKPETSDDYIVPRRSTYGSAYRYIGPARTYYGPSYRYIGPAINAWP